MALLTASSPRQTSLGLAILRLGLGGAMTAHGAQKFFVYGIPGVIGAFHGMGVPAPGIAAPLIAVVELVGGIAIVLGLLTRVAALGVALDMLGALLMVRLKGGYFAPDGGEYEILLFAAAVALLVTGAGALSLDQAILDRRGR